MAFPRLFIFLDESGNFDCSPKGTRYFVLTSLSTTDAEEMAPALYRLKHELILAGQDIEYFHATEDQQAVRDRVFEILAGGTYELDTVIVEKAKTHPSLHDEARFYPTMCHYLLQYALRRHEWRGFESFVIFTDALNVKRKREAIQKGLKEGLRSVVGRGKAFRLLHHASKSHPYLQAVDYCNWAVYVKWERGERRPYQMIQEKLKSEFEIFKGGAIRYY
jgi:hypothetical protein